MLTTSKRYEQLVDILEAVGGGVLRAALQASIRECVLGKHTTIGADAGDNAQASPSVVVSRKKLGEFRTGFGAILKFSCGA
jgi:hypothetical protein